ncbi:GD17483 [Drosophila simulans]|uniref:GD17483 n=1 Tax=Drosophila simulans TaxID=7240 RepID=B4R2X0_DROSI|nr:GD17483 [Drosophila simulans]
MLTANDKDVDAKDDQDDGRGNPVAETETRASTFPREMAVLAGAGGVGGKEQRCEAMWLG